MSVCNSSTGSIAYLKGLRDCCTPVLAIAGDADPICPPVAVTGMPRSIPKLQPFLLRLIPYLPSLSCLRTLFPSRVSSLCFLILFPRYLISSCRIRNPQRVSIGIGGVPALWRCLSKHTRRASHSAYRVARHGYCPACGDRGATLFPLRPPCWQECKCPIR